MMNATVFQSSSRLWKQSTTDSTVTRDLLILVSSGVLAAACSTFVKLHLSIPGHAILKVILPMCLGYAAAPRRSAGTIMGVSALVSTIFFRGLFSMEPGLGIGSFTSLILFGPVLDLFARSLQRPVSAWFHLAAAGLITNAGAFFVRGSFKIFGRDDAVQKIFTVWLSTAYASYAICGLLAGLICGVIFFRAKPDPAENE